MANVVVKNFQQSKHLFKGLTNKSMTILPKKQITVYADSGAICNKPAQVKFGLAKLTLVAFPFLYLGATISKNGAAFLEENDIFVPDDDDD